MGKTSSLRVQIGLLYSLLAFVNIVFFSVMIFENQSDLLVRSFQIQSENLAISLAEEISSLSAPAKESDSISEELVSRLAFYEIRAYRFLDTQGNLIPEEAKDSTKVDFPEGEKLISILKDLDTGKSGSVFQSRYNLDLNEEDFSLFITLPVPAKTSPYFLQASIVLTGIGERLRQIYLFMGIAVGWGILFHVIFAVFVYRVIFRRLGLLKEASNSMEAGELGARADWERKRHDELDDLGDSFNAMADSIQSHIATVTRLNKEINLELQIGKEVQELFLPKKKIFKEFSPGIFYRPMREVSGDIYLFYKNEKRNSYSCFLADASGHGVSAALVTVTIAMFLESVLKEESAPGKIISELSNLMGFRLQASFFATAVVAEWDGKDLVVCNGGHNAPLVYRSSQKSIMQVESSGPPLGMVDDHEYKEERFSLEGGDRIFFYTDGLVESQDVSGFMYGLDRVKENLSRYWEEGMDNGEVAKNISQDLDSFTSEYKDDVTIVTWEIPRR